MEMTETQDHLNCGNQTARTTPGGNWAEEEGKQEIKSAVKATLEATSKMADRGKGVRRPLKVDCRAQGRIF